MRNKYYGETSFYILPMYDECMMERIVRVSFSDKTTKSMISGWVDYQDKDNFVADVAIYQKY